ncbi:hypothetical protein JCM1840_002585 [Sporobolomyces johnsonii]
MHSFGMLRPLSSSSRSRLGFARSLTTSVPHTAEAATVGVIGAGQMGLGIAYVAARTAGVQVLLADRSQSQLSKALAFADTLLDKEVSKGKLSKDEAVEVRARIKVVSGIEQFGESGVDLAIEAVSESLPVKQQIFSALATHLAPSAILASNTSSISLSKLAASAVSSTTGESRAQSVVGFHFFNPVPVMTLVELIPALQTHPSIVAQARAFAQRMGKTVTTSRDSPGFISNRLIMPYINEACIVLETGVATRDDIDQTMKLGMRHPMGPLELADFIGLDTCLSIMKVLHTETGDSKYRPSVLLDRMVSANHLGKKSGVGFYDYRPTPPPPPPPSPAAAATTTTAEGGGDADSEAPAPYGDSNTA